MPSSRQRRKKHKCFKKQEKRGFIGPFFYFYTMRKCALLAFVLAPAYLFASFEFNDNCRQAYAAIIRLKFSEGEKMLAKERASNPSNRIPVLLDNYIDFLTLLIGEDPAEYAKRKSNRDARLELLKDEDGSSPYQLFSRAEIGLQWAFVQVRFGDHFSAALGIKKAFGLLKKNEKRFPDFLPQKKTLGVLHALAGAIPGKYKWAADLAGVKGSVPQGIAELADTYQAVRSDPSFRFLEEEVLFFLATITQNLGNNDAALEKLLRVFELENYNGPLMVFCRAGICMHTGQNDKALEVLSQRRDTAGEFRFHYLDYLKGSALMNKLDGRAVVSLGKYVSEFRGMSYIRAAYQKLAWAALLKDDTSGYRKMMGACARVGASLTDEDKQALTEAKEKNIPNQVLLRARLLFDGGYYQQALDVLLAQKPSQALHSQKENIEFVYRLARIHHRLGNSDKAIAYYGIVIGQSEKLPYYFASNSWLQLGTIYENRNEPEKARKCYQKCLSLTGHEYQDSIDQKAKAGLNRLNDRN